MRGDPVHDDADARLVAAVDKAHEILRRAVAGGRGKVARDLIAPRRVERILGQRHELDVREAHVLHVGDQLVGQLFIGEDGAVRVLAPGTGVHLVDVDRLVVVRLFPLVLKPRAVVPVIAGNIVKARSGARARLRMERIRVALQNRFAARVGDGQLIHGVRLERLVRVALPDRVVDLCQRVPVRVPAAEIAGDRNRLRIRRPDTADGACFAVPHRVVHPHVLVGVAVLTAPEQIERHISLRRFYRILFAHS